MAIKFSQFNTKTTSADVQFIVGYNGLENVKITPTNFLGAFSSLDFIGDTGTGNVNLAIQSFSIVGTASEIETSASAQTLTIGLPDDVTIGNNLTVTGSITQNSNTVTNTFNGDVAVSGTNKYLKIGASNELLLYHHGTDGYITNNTGDLKIISLIADKDVIISADNGSGGATTPYIVADGSLGQVQLNYYGATKLNTINTGVSITGDAEVSGTVAFGILQDTGESINISKFVDEADGIPANDNDTSIPTSAAVKDYVDSQVTAQDLDIQGDSGTGSVDLDSQALTIAGTANQTTTVASGQTITIGLPSSVVITGTYFGTTFDGQLDGTISSTTTAVTQPSGDNSAFVATTAYVDIAAGNYLPLAGGTMSGSIAMGGNDISNVGDITLSATKKLKYADNKIIIGNTGLTLGSEAISIGYSANSTGAQSIGIGYNPTPTGAQSIGVGYVPSASGNQSISTGYAPTASGQYSIALGYVPIASGSKSVAIGFEVEATGINTFVFGADGGSYSDNNTLVASGLDLKVTGTGQSSFAGQVTIPATPVASTDAASKGYVDSQVTAQDLDFTGDSGTGQVDLDSQALSITGGAVITTTALNQNLDIVHDSVSRTDTTSTDAPAFGGTFTAVDSVTSSTEGHITAINLKTVTVPTPTYPTVNNNTITISAGSNLNGGGSFTLNQNTDDTITVNLDTTITGLTSVTSTTFIGGLQGNADTATALAASGNITLTGDTTSTGGPYTYTSGGNVAIATTIADTTVTGKLITGVNLGTAQNIAATDTILEAFGYLQAQITQLPQGLVYNGTWNASTNTPTLTSGSGTTGHFYIVSVAGSTNLDGITDWQVGDWAIFVEAGGTDTWQKIDNTSAITGTGATNKLAKWTGPTTLSTGLVEDDGTTVTIGNSGDLDVTGDADVTGDLAWSTSLTDSTNLISITKFVDEADGIPANDNDTSIPTSAAVKDYVDSQVGANDTLAEILANGNTTGGTDIAITAGDKITNFTSTGIDDNASSTALTIDTSGNVGIGTSGSPDSKLHVDSGVSSTSDWGNLGIISDFPINNAGRIYTSYLLQDSESIKGAGIGLAYDGTGYKMHFGTASTTSSGLSTQMTIDRSGNVGIGTDNPYAELSIRSTSPQVYLETPSSGNVQINFNENADQLDIMVNNSVGKIAFGTNSTERMRIDSSGNVGIGTTSIDSSDGRLKLSAPSGASNVAGIALYGNNSGGFGGSNVVRSKIESQSDGTAFGAIMKFYTNDTSNVYQERMRIDSSGTISIGPSATSSEIYFNYNNTNNKGGLKIDYSTAELRLTAGESGNTYYQAFYLNGSERMRIDSSGNVGIGETSPTSKLHVKDTPVATSGAILTLRNSQATASNTTFGGIFFSSTPGYDFSIGKSNVNSTTTLSFRNGNSGASLMDIDAAGNVGIGTDSPSSRLQSNNTSTYNSSTPSGAIIASNLSSGNAILDIGVDSSTLGYIQSRNVASTTTYNLQLNPLGGNVGIGTDSPTNILSVHQSDASSNSYVHITQANSGSAATDGISIGLESNGVDAAIRNRENGYLRMFTNNTERMRIDSSGNVGIGLTDPSTYDVSDNPILAVGSTSTAAYSSQISILSGSSGYGYLLFGDGSGSAGYIGQVRYDHANNKMQFNTNGSTAMSIDSSGNVGIGTDSPNAKLEIGTTGGTAKPDALRISNASDYSYYWDIWRDNTTGYLNFGSATGGSLTTQVTIKDLTGNVGIGTTSPSQKLHVVGKALITDDVQLTGSSPRIDFNSNGSSALRFYDTTNAAERMRINTSGNVGIGTTSPAVSLDVNSGNSDTIARFESTDNRGRIQIDDNDTTVYAIAENSKMSLGTSNTLSSTNLTIDSSGNVGIGTTSPTYKFHVASSNNVSIFEDTSGSSGATFCLFNAPSVFAMGSITRNGSATSVLFNTSSDYRLKEDLQDFNALDLVDNITAYDYKWKDTEQRDYGFVAHELQDVMPNVVTGEKDGEEMQKVDYSKLTPVLLKAIQELKAEIETLKAQINN